MSFYSAIYQEDLSARSKLVYMYLKDRANKEGQCWPAIQTIGKDLGLSRSTVKRALKELERGSFLAKQSRKRENNGNASNLYSLIS